MSASNPGPGTKPWRISRPCAVRIGTFCRLGLSLDRRPVAATICLNVVWIRPSSATVGSSCFSTTMSSRVISRWCSSRSITGWVPSRFCSASASVVQPVLIFLVLGSPSSSKSRVWSCLGLPRWNSCPTLSYADSAAALTRSRSRVSRSTRWSTSAAMPTCSQSASTPTSGSSRSLSSAVPPRRCRSWSSATARSATARACSTVGRRGGRVGDVLAAVEGELAVGLGRLGPQLAPQVAQREVAEVELPWPGSAR